MGNIQCLPIGKVVEALLYEIDLRLLRSTIGTFSRQFVRKI